MIQFSVSSFLSEIDRQGGLSRPSYYECRFVFPVDQGPIPTALVTLMGERTQGLLCRNVQLPEQALETTTLGFMGYPVRIPGKRTPAVISLTFFNTNNYRLRQAFEQWQDLFQSYDTNQRTARQSTYATMTLTAYHRGAEGPDYTPQPLAEYTFSGVYPQMISSLPFAMDQETTPQEYTVELSYLQMTTVQVSEKLRPKFNSPSQATLSTV